VLSAIIGFISFFAKFTVIEYFFNFILATSLPIIIILWVLFKKKNDIKDKFWNNAGHISEKVEKYCRIIWIWAFAAVMPILLIAGFLITKNIFSVYYILMICLSAVFPLSLIYFFAALYNLILKIKTVAAWKKFGINVLIFILTFVYLDILFGILGNFLRKTL
jgi:hypothetical protein